MKKGKTIYKKLVEKVVIIGYAIGGKRIKKNVYLRCNQCQKIYKASKSRLDKPKENYFCSSKCYRTFRKKIRRCKRCRAIILYPKLKWCNKCAKEVKRKQNKRYAKERKKAKFRCQQCGNIFPLTFNPRKKRNFYRLLKLICPVCGKKARGD